MKPTVAVGLTLAAFLTLGTISASSAPATTAARDGALVRQLQELLHTRTQLAVLQLRLAKEIQERLNHLHPKTKRCVLGLPGTMDNCDLPTTGGLQEIWEAGAGRRRAVMGVGASDNLDGQQAVDALGNHDIYSDMNSAGKRGLLGIAGGSDNFDGQGALDARNQYNAFNDPNTPGKKRRGLLPAGHFVGDDNVFDFDYVAGPGKRGTLLGLAGGSDNFDGQGALDARDQYELFNSGRTPGKRSQEKRR